MNTEILQSSNIAIHFDIPAHGLPLKTFVETASAAEEVIESLIDQIFNGSVEYSLIVLPPEVGSFRSKLKIIVISVGAALLPALATDFTSGLIEGLTNRNPNEWGELAGQELRNLFSSEAIADEPEEEQTSFIRSQECRAVAKMLAAATSTFMQRPTKELIESNISTEMFREAFAARNAFYIACLEHHEISGVSFADTEDFEVPRSAFIELQTVIPPKVEEEDELPWHVETTTIIVSSPNWAKSDSKRHWKGKDSDGHDRYFTIDDDSFWFLAEHEMLNFHFADRLRVQIKYHLIDDRKIHNTVLRVLRYNSRPVSEPLSEDELEELIGPHKKGENTQNQFNLFDDQ
ncbi:MULTISPECIES: hypothetical protein [Thalassospira]|uniref:Uncharacterized protein n=2 Tax=Thalassospira TaxID=168934 RepID=A0A367WCK4_9PROT|nr:MULTISPECIES: hypothetical protein [Thalassospira]MDG4717415.1 hypothetical protein [Thalassospira sp. FZY0004]RCK39107.1 hypothetical protein TH19_04825 [Thalassospira profundimaris]